MSRTHVGLALVAACSLSLIVPARPHAQAPSTQAAPPQLGVLAPDNLAKPRPKPPFNLTGTWQHDGRYSTWRFVPETFKLTPQAQVHYDKGQQALKAGGVYRDDIGQCWPAGMPLIMTRVWPISMVQLPTVIYMISAFENSIRVIYLDGRPHMPADEVVRTFDGESIGHWDGDALVVDTMYFPGHHHWLDQGGASVPASQDLHIVERFRLINEGKTLEVNYTLTDPKSWEGDWKFVKRFNRKDDADIVEGECLPDLNEHLPATTSKSIVK